MPQYVFFQRRERGARTRVALSGFFIQIKVPTTVHTPASKYCTVVLVVLCGVEKRPELIPIVDQIKLTRKRGSQKVSSVLFDDDGGFLENHIFLSYSFHCTQETYCLCCCNIVHKIEVMLPIILYTTFIYLLKKSNKIA